MAKYEATQGQWRRAMGALPGLLTAELPGGDDFPVGNVNFAEADAFCQRLTERARQSGALPKDWEFRLPTEAQWEYACRAGTTTATAFGNILSSRQANFKGQSYNGAEQGPSLNRAAAVGSYPANAWGLHDMHGNFTGDPVNAMQRLCVGVEGPYLELRGHFSGAITSSDSRLTGTLDFMAEQALVSLATGLGTFKGRFQISDASGAQTAQGQFFTVVTEGGLNHGFALGKVMSAGGGGADDFFARFQSTLDASLHAEGRFGDPTGDVRLPAAVQGGSCSGRWMRVP